MHRVETLWISRKFPPPHLDHAGCYTHAAQDLLEWKRPFRSLSVMSGLLLVAYHDLVRYALPLALLSNVAFVFGEVSAGDAQQGVRYSMPPS